LDDFTAIDAFCGAGGMSLGLQRAGFRIASAFDLDPAAVLTHSSNLGGVAFVADATDVSGEDLLSRSGLDRGQLSLLCGGPPCQGFSRQRKGAARGDDPRNALIFQFFRLVEEIMPCFFLFENVDLVGGCRGRDLVDEVMVGMQCLDYRFIESEHRSDDFGVAQTRRRYTIVGQLWGKPFRQPVPNGASATVLDAIGDLPSPPLDGSDHPDFPNHSRTAVTPINIERFSHVPPGGGWRDIPVDLMLPCHRRILDAGLTSGMWPDVYGRLEWDRPAPTITSGFDSFSRGRYGHPSEDRPITPREAARLQGFPDWFVFHGNRRDVRSQIGNAVPPPLAEAIGRSILDALS
jgi:DNA (cytosine-5)-methyltransferase 1